MRIARRWVPAAAEAVAVVLLSTITVVLTHDIPYLLKAPYWLDEAWVAVSGRLPVSDLLSVTSSTPPGWNLLQRALLPFGDQAQRMLPLVFIVGTGIVAYYAARELVREHSPLPRLVGGLAALAVLLVPATLARNDLKQYTCDGFIAVLILLCATVAARNGWSSRAVWVLVGVGAIGFAISITSIFMIGAVGVVWLVQQLVLRRWRSLRGGALPFALLLLVVVVLYVVVYAPASNPQLNDYWNAYYPSIGELPRYLLDKARTLGPILLFGHWWPTAIGTVIAVLITTIRWRSVIGFVPVCLGVLMVGAGIARRYPLLDARTSHFLLIVATFFAAVGISALVLVACMRVARSAALRLTLAGVATAALAVSMGIAAAPHARAHSIPAEDARSQIEYVQEHSKPSDVILLNDYAGYAFGYYWTRNTPSWIPYPKFATNFQISYPESTGIEIATSDDRGWVDRAAALAKSRGGSLWVIRTHVSADTRKQWDDALKGATTIDTGTEPLAVVRP